jgi:hypothetical protein
MLTFPERPSLQSRSTFRNGGSTKDQHIALLNKGSLLLCLSLHT